MRVRIKPRFWVIMMVALCLVFGTLFLALQHSYTQGAAQLRAVEAQRDELVLQVSALSGQLDFARTDEYVIRTARDELGMIMPGEVRYVNGAR